MTRHNKHWTASEHARLEQMLDEGYGYEAIARRLGRTFDSVRSKAQRRGVSFGLTVWPMSAYRCALLMGVDHKRLARWIRDGWLAARRARTEGRPGWRITWEAFDAFLSNPDYFMAWDARHIQDSDLRAWAMELRAGHARWLTLEEVGKRIGISVEPIRQRILGGRLPAVKRRQAWYVRETDIAPAGAHPAHPRQRSKPQEATACRTVLEVEPLDTTHRQRKRQTWCPLGQAEAANGGEPRCRHRQTPHDVTCQRLGAGDEEGSCCPRLSHHRRTG